jgi:CBS domain-containing protein
MAPLPGTVAVVARTNLEHAADLTVADVIHERFSALPSGSTIGDVRAWFAISAHRKMAFLAADGRYAGSITRSDVGGDLDPARPASEVARYGPTVAPEAPARTGHELALQADALRVPVVDRDGTLVGVVGVTDDRAGFCGT